MNTTIISALFDYFENCPLMTENRLNVDYLPENTGQAGVEFAIATEPTDETVYTYHDGGARCKYPFVISSVNDYGPDDAQNILNSGFFENLARWLRLQTRTRNFPILPEGMSPRSIRAIGPGYLFQPDVNAGKYQIQCELEYYRKGD
ncbi:MAG: hypothetical protein GX222_08920 [Ruminococcaceae bacterium]|nr:hypothetical protein [Oscillospiraceae bacterium]